MFIFTREFFLVCIWVFTACVVLTTVDPYAIARKAGVEEGHIQIARNFVITQFGEAERQLVYFKAHLNNKI